MIDEKQKLIEKNIILRKLKISNISKNYFNWFNDDFVKKYIKSQYSSQDELLSHVSKEIKKKNQIFFGIFLNKKKSKHIGNVKFHNIDIKKKNAWLGILIGEKKYRNRGFGKDAILLGCKFLFEKYSINNFCLYVSKNNIPAIKSYLHCGFKIAKKIRNEFLMIFNYQTNRLILGTAQFGKPYGISNKKKKRLNFKDILKILNYSKNDIQEVDTSEDYQIDQNIKKKLTNFTFNTKIDFDFFYRDIHDIKSFFSIKNQFKKINILFVRDLENNLDNHKIFKKICYLKKNKIIKKIGISIYSYENLLKLYKLIKFDVIQAPINIFDNRCDKFEKFILSNNIEVYARSVFLQGLFFLHHESLKGKKMGILKKPLLKLRNYQRKSGYNMYDIALSHVFRKNYVKKIIVGVHNVSQLKKIMNFNYINTMRKISRLSNDDVTLIDPRLW